MNPIVALIIGIVVGAIDVLVLLLTIISIESTSPVDDNLRPLRLKRTIEIIILVVCVLLIIYGINPSAVSTPGKLFGLIWKAIKGFFMIIGYPFVWYSKGSFFWQGAFLICLPCLAVASVRSLLSGLTLSMASAACVSSWACFWSDWPCMASPGPSDGCKPISGRHCACMSSLAADKQALRLK